MANTVKNTDSVITKKDLFKSWFIWINSHILCSNWERMQNVGYTVAMAPILKKLYPHDKEKFNKRLSAHMAFYNTEPQIGTIVNGITIALEEEKAKGKDIPDETINAAKTSMMGPLAGIGDSIVCSLLNIILLSIGMNLAYQGNILGPIFFAVSWLAIVCSLSWWLMLKGYGLGINSLSILSPAALSKVTAIMSIIGLTVLGGLSAAYVSLKTPLVFAGTNGTSDLVVQDMFNKIMPGLLPLLLVVGCYFLLAKKNMSALKLIGIMFVGGTALSLLGIL